MPDATTIMFYLLRQILPQKVFNESIVETANRSLVGLLKFSDKFWGPIRSPFT